MIKIEVARIFKLDGTGSVKAYADISVADSLLIKGVRIVEGKDGLFVAMPQESGKDGKWYNTVIPMSREIREEIEKIVLEAYGAD